MLLSLLAVFKLLLCSSKKQTSSAEDQPTRRSALLLLLLIVRYSRSMTASPPVVTPAPSSSSQATAGASHNSNNSSTGAKDELWLNKLESGTSLTPADWELIESEKNDLPWYTKKNASGDHGAYDEESKKVAFVRVLGVVQHMMDTEYLQQETSPCGGTLVDGTAVTSSWTERTPLVITPIPFATDWFERSAYCSSSATRTSGSHRDGNKQGENDADADEGPIKKKLRLSIGNNGLDKEEETNEEDEESDHGGFLRQCEEYEPLVLAKLYYDKYVDHAKKTRLRLNDVVELVGVLEHHSGVEEDHDVRMAETYDESSWWDSGMELGAATLPKTLPRLHVLWFRPKDLDALAAVSCCLHPSNHPQQMPMPPSLTRPGAALARALKVSDVVGEALHLTLLSAAERRAKPEEDLREEISISDHWAPAIRAEDMTLGCASLNVVLESGEACCRFQNDLERTLKEVVPQVVSIDLSSVASSPALTLKTAVLPTQKAGRLVPTPFQLPKGSTLILNVGTVMTYITPSLSPTILQELQELTRGHRICYFFEGGVKIPFEADIRVIVLSTPSTRNLLPCSLQVKCCPIPAMDEDAMADGDDSNGQSSAPFAAQLVSVRHALAMARMPSGAAADAGGVNGSNSMCGYSFNNILLPHGLLKRASNDFIARRTAAREKKQHGAAVVDENSLHRWLTLTRLIARSRMARTAELQDWERALQVDDSLEASSFGK